MFGEQQMTMMVTAEQFENPMYCSEIPSDLNYNLMFPSTSNGCAAIVPERSPPVSQLLRRPSKRYMGLAMAKFYLKILNFSSVLFKFYWILFFANSGV